MRAFAGFSDRTARTPVPTPWLRAVLAETESLAELKVTLHVFRLLDSKRDYPRFVRASELRGDPDTMAGLRLAGGISCEDALAEGIRLSLARGVFVAVSLEIPAADQATAPADGAARAARDECLFLNTPANRELIARVLRGEVALAPGPPAAPVLLPERRPTIYELYEQNVGLLTPLLVDELRDAAETYPAEWIEEAFREAVGYNRRHWRYIRRILENWATQGRAESGVPGGRPQAPRDPRRYIEGKYGHLVQH